MTRTVSRSGRRLRHGWSTASSGCGSQGGPDRRRQERTFSVVGGLDGSAASNRALRILVVEDDPGMRLLCSVNLELAGFSVELAATGLEGLERASQKEFDLVLLDVMLPDLGGLDVAERLRSASSTAGLPIVFFSARASQADIEQGRLAGAIDYIVKPFDPLTLAHRLLEDFEEHRRSGHDGVRLLRFGPSR